MTKLRPFEYFGPATCSARQALSIRVVSWKFSQTLIYRASEGSYKATYSSYLQIPKILTGLAIVTSNH